MSGFHALTDTKPQCRTFGPAQRSRLDLMGIRFFVPEDTDLGGGGGGAGGGGEGGDKPITFKSQADLDRIITDRVNRATSKFADYDDIKKKADQLDQLEVDKLGDGEKVADRISKLENRATTAEAALEPLQQKLLRYEVAAAKKLDLAHAPRLQGATKEEIEADADAFITSLGVTSVDKSKKLDPGQGGRDEEKAGSKGKSEAERRFGDKAAK